MRNPQVGDLNNDGYTDLLLSDADLVCKVNPWPWTPGYGRVYHFQGGPNNSLTKVGFIKDTNGDSIDIGDCSIPILADWNNDEKLDLILGTYGPHDESNALFYEWRIYLNTGTKEQYKFLNWSTLTDNNNNPILASTLLIRDLDRDGKKDIVFSLNRNVEMGWYRNIGTSSTPEFNTYQEINLPSGIALNFEFFELADITGDNILDLIYVDMYYPYYCKGKDQTLIQGKQIKTERIYWDISTTNKKLKVFFPSEKYLNASIQIYNSQGKSIYKGIINHRTISLNISVSGWYNVAIKSNNLCERKSFLIN